MHKLLSHIIVVIVAMAAATLCGCRNGAHYDVDRNAYPVRGIDVSAHNGDIDFAKVAADSITFVYVKASEGTEYCDAMFGRNFENAKQAGLKVSAYHYFRFDEPGHLQAYNFLRALTGRNLDMPIAIDVEDWQNANGIPQQEVIDQLSNMIGVIVAAGFRPIIYTNKKGYEAYVKGIFPFPVWICSFAELPDNMDWRIWQHSHKGRVNGIVGDVDLDTFNGTMQQFEGWRK